MKCEFIRMQTEYWDEERGDRVYFCWEQVLVMQDADERPIAEFVDTPQFTVGLGHDISRITGRTGVTQRTFAVEKPQAIFTRDAEVRLGPVLWGICLNREPEPNGGKRMHRTANRTCRTGSELGSN
jgi:hypothetical protein